jgi:hypothetical protein
VRFAPRELKPNLSFQLGSYGHLFTRLSEVKKMSDVDILFLGSSHAYRGFDTRIYSSIGLKTFNLGSSAQTPIQTQILIERYIDKLNPKLIIYEVYPESFTSDGVESSLDLISNDKNDFKTFEMSMKINNIKVYNTLIYAITRDLFGLNASFSEKRVKNKDTYISGGYVQRKVGFFEPVDFEKKEINLDSKQVKSFEKIIHYVKNKKIKIIFVYAPIPKSNYSSYFDNQGFDCIIKNYGEYYNFNKIMEINDSLDFYDSDHLNQIGVKKFNLKLIEILGRNKYLNLKIK